MTGYLAAALAQARGEVASSVEPRPLPLFAAMPPARSASEDRPVQSAQLRTPEPPVSSPVEPRVVVPSGEAGPAPRYQPPQVTHAVEVLQPRGEATPSRSAAESMVPRHAGEIVWTTNEAINPVGVSPRHQPLVVEGEVEQGLARRAVQVGEPESVHPIPRRRDDRATEGPTPRVESPGRAPESPPRSVVERVARGVEPSTHRAVEPSKVPDVQVTIGRLEVRVVPPAPATRPARTPSPVMTLEQYLDRRAGGRP
jgi:hypothetical protein